MSEVFYEIDLAIEMGADTGHVALTIHAHSIISESIGFAAKIFEGNITFRPNPKVKKNLYIANKVKVSNTAFLEIAGLDFILSYDL
jgi:hypothetical protein